MITSLTTAQAAKQLGVTRPRVLTLIYEGRLKAQKIGTQYLISPQDLAKLKIGKTGRPKKTTESGPVKKSAKRKSDS